jgi:very-short-patch-repair endonuclease
VIEQAFGLMQTHPERSIGIVAMNAKQTELLQNEFDRLIVEEERVRKYVDAFAGTIDEFFIKNLENVQGDERDIILISTVYGPDKNGAVRQNFGLMNREVGWRRLNVLVSRAKMSCRLITSLRPDDVKVTDKSSKGVIAFKSYLTYAHGGAQYDDASGAETDSDFEIFVADALRAGGYEVVYQVGVEKFRIDLGVRHASCPVGFIAGIECDGAPYHSGLSVRDRDHIRQTILENLGWNIYRVWSTDWFADPARETAKLLSWLEQVRERVVRELGSQAQPVEVRKPKQRITAAPISPVADQPTAEASETVVVPTEPAIETPTGPREPRGRELRSIGDFQTYEAIRGKLYEIWRDETFLGEVEVVRRATAAPRLYGDRAIAAQSEYEGRVEATGDAFRSFDLYAAMREVAHRADLEP